MHFDPSIVTVKQSSIVSQIVGSVVFRSSLVLLNFVNKSFCTVPVTVGYDSVASVLS